MRHLGFASNDLHALQQLRIEMRLQRRRIAQHQIVYMAVIVRAFGAIHDWAALQSHPAGVFSWRPPVALVEELSDLLDGLAIDDEEGAA